MRTRAKMGETMSIEEYRKLNRAKGTGSKFSNRHQQEDGYTFDSKRELARYRELRLMERAGKISHLEVHQIYEFIHNKILICKYEADFRYIDGDGKTTIEDAKGALTYPYRIKKKMMLAFFGIEIKEV